MIQGVAGVILEPVLFGVDPGAAWRPIRRVLKISWAILGLVLLALAALWWFSRSGPTEQEPAPVADSGVGAAQVAPEPRPRHPIPLSPATAREDRAATQGSFSGRVLSTTTGAGVPDAELTFGYLGVANSAVTGPDGRFEFRPPKPGAYQLAAIVAPRHLPFGPAWGHSPIQLQAREGERVEGLIFYLSPATELYGVVQAPDGGVVAGAEVRVLETAPDSTQPLPSRGPFVSDAEGEFKLVAPEGTALEASHPDFAPGRAVIGEGAFAGQRVAIRLGEKGSAVQRLPLGGRVADAQGNATPGARVVADRLLAPNERFRDTELPTFSALTDGDGRFRFGELDPGRYALVATLEGEGRAELRDVAAGTLDAELKLERGAIVRGQVRDAKTKAPVTAFTVDLQRRFGPLARGAFRTVAFVDPGGQFRLEGARPGSYAVQVAAHGYAISSELTVVVPDPAVDPAEVEVLLERGGRVHGKVLDEKTRQPLADALVSLEGGIAEAAASLPVTARAQTDAAGHFELTGLAAGLRSITVLAAGHHGRILSGLKVENDGSIGPVEVALAPVDPGDTPRLELVGIGAVLTPKGDALLVGRVIEGGGASEAGVVPGDLVLAIDGEPVAQLGFEGAVNHIRGPEGSTVVLTLQRDQPQELRVYRRRLRAP